MKKLFTIFFVILSFSAFAQTLKYGDYTVSISNVSTDEYDTTMFDTKNHIIEYSGNYVIYKKSEKIAEQKFSAMDMGNVTTVNIKNSDISGNTVTYEKETKVYEYMGEEKAMKKAKNPKDIILNSIAYYAELSYSK
ncbi:hypothetical protein PFY12_03130 [Chryseobacterium camelliae]|uniref:Lipocalin-like domain-containing protein n=1 Tax=Chryseobacterium camelliae TaxID=1265445 RepID=A0ABY7QN86_9FLAO|nr:hypothetical protein [Chryseobacterium camelliae]WBV61120.1 hypothetical protein PFY12_03130 [Chryseobacterium camelliae]